MSGAIEPIDECKVFGEGLVYFFYGRPAYKVRIEEGLRFAEDYLPIALIFASEAVGDPARAFPFDSGAFASGAFDSIRHKKIPLASFELEPSFDGVRRSVTAFFETNRRYLLGEVTNRGLPNNMDDPEARSHYALIEGASDDSIDDRRYTVEVQSRELVLLSSAIAIIMPHKWLKSVAVKKFASENPSVKLISYAKYKGTTVSGSHAVIFEHAYDYLLKGGYIQEDEYEDQV
ncbi:MAG: hypothetical protein EON95_04060 [Caulobacteraceae bacterium]|nr:MAG: hypothetical protein EON95_04060 [Caulobacteraceae bacterium]